MVASWATSELEPERRRAPGAAGWKAELEVEFSERSGRTLPTRRRHRGPLVVQRPFYPEGRDACHLDVLHPPGGLVGGDELVIDIAAQAGATALVTTPAAGKVYRSRAAPARQRFALRIAPGARLEWLPQETILFEEASLEATLRIDFEAGSRFLAWDAVCFGRIAAGESFARGTYRQSLEVRKDGELVLLEPLLVEPRLQVRE